MTSDSYAIELDEVTKSFRSLRALNRVSMRVPEGSVFGYIGPNGAGKTTTLRILLDLIRPNAGSVRVLGMDPRHDGAAIRAQVGYLPGELTLWPHMLAGDALKRLADVRGVTDYTYMHELAERFALTLHRPIGELSKGNRQKIGIVQAFMHHPRLLLLDEPTAGLDPLMQRTFYGLVRETCDRGATILVSSHVLTEVDRIAHRVGIIRDGEIVAVDDITNLTTTMATVITVHFDRAVQPAQIADVPGVTVDPQLDTHELRLQVQDNIPAVLRRLADLGAVGIQAQRGDLEQLFMQYYGSADQAADSTPKEAP